MTDSNWFYRKKGKKWILIFLILCVNLLIIEAILFDIEPYWGDMNYYLGEFIGWEGNYALLLAIFIGIPAIYGGILFILNLRKLILTDKSKPHFLHKILAVGLLIFFNTLLGALIYLFGEESILVVSLIENISVFIYLGLSIGLFILLYPLIGYIQRLLKQSIKTPVSPRTKAIIIISCLIIGYGVGLSLPFLLRPVNIISGDLPSKPKIIAHRGASHLAPENTLIAAELAVNLSVAGWEIDVQISRDGVPFLMHDDTLKRTTNVSAEFPGRENEPACNFTWAELRRLDAGSWFVEKDPYRAIAKGILTPNQIKKFYNVPIPSLEEAVNFTRDHGLILDVDFKGVPDWHPYYATYFNICLSYLKSAGIDTNIWIATGNRYYLNITRIEAPNMITALSIEVSDPLPVNEFLAMEYDMINVHNSLSYDVIRAYSTAGIPINAWTVDSIARFSQLWCANVTYIVTNEPHKFVGLMYPNWYMHIEIYVLFWVVIYFTGLSYVFLLKKPLGAITNNAQKENG